MTSLKSHLDDLKRKIQMNHRVLLLKQQDSHLLASLQHSVTEMQQTL